MECKRGATYILTSKAGGGRKKDHAFTCGTHLGEMVRGGIEGAYKCRVQVAYCPAPGDQPCEFGGRRF